MPTVGGTGIAVGTWSTSPASQARAQRIHDAMVRAAQDCSDRGVTDEKEILAAINAAKDAAERE